MANPRAPWYAAGVTSILTAIGSGLAGYYASGAGSSVDQVRSNEHRITQIEDSGIGHSRADCLNTHNVWYAIAFNHGDPLPPQPVCP